MGTTQEVAKRKRAVEASDSHSKGKRPERIPMGAPDVLKFSKREGYNRRVFNDKDGRIERAKAAGYQAVHGDERGGEIKAGDASATGSVVSKPVGGGVTGVLMEIPQEWYDEDQKKKQDRLDEIEQDMSTEKKAGLSGELKVTWERHG